MRYRHEKTGAIIDVKSEMGGCWVPMKEPGAPPKPEPGKKTGRKAPATKKE